MLPSSFSDTLLSHLERGKSPCVVGLDPDLARIPRVFFGEAGRAALSRHELARVLEEFCLEVIELVRGRIPIIKPQIAYFEVLGSDGIAALERVVSSARNAGLLVLLDAKRGDVPQTASVYAQAYLGHNAPYGCECDGITVNPYLGADSLAPFFKKAAMRGKAVFVCARTSNPGSADLQSRVCEDGTPMFELAASLCSPSLLAPSQSGYHDAGLVLGGTYPGSARQIRARFSTYWFLVPGFGAQGASVETASAFFNPDGRGALLSASRSILFASAARSLQDWRAAVRGAADDFADGASQAASGMPTA